MNRPATQVEPSLPSGEPEHASGDAGAAFTSPLARKRIVHFAEAYALLGLTVILGLFFSIYPSTSATFPTLGNLQATLGNQAVLAIVAVGALVPLAGNQYDFSVGANMGLSAVLAGTALSHGASIWVAFLVAVGSGLAIGLFNGLLVTRARVNSIIATLGTTSILAGVVQWKTSGIAIVNGISASLTNFGAAIFLGIPVPVYVALGIAGGVYYVLQHTSYGRYVQMVGSNRAASRLVGLDVSRVSMWAFVLAGGLAGSAGLLEIARIGVANPQVGPDFTLPAIAAAFLSIAAIKPGRFNVAGTLVAILFLGVLNSGLNLAGANSYVNNIANGVALIAGVGLAGLFGRRRGDPSG